MPRPQQILFHLGPPEWLLACISEYRSPRKDWLHHLRGVMGINGFALRSHLHTRLLPNGVMQHYLRGLHWRTFLLYLDNIITVGWIFRPNRNSYRRYWLALKVPGCGSHPSASSRTRNRTVPWLSETGVSTDPRKVAAVVKWSWPGNLTELTAFLGMVGYYYRQCIINFATLAKPAKRLSQI